jgi:uncharacterized protein
MAAVTGLRPALRAACTGVLLTLFGSLAACGSQSEPADNERNPAGAYTDLVIETSGGARHFSIEFADTPDQRMVGLMYRTHLDPDKGMLFDFDEPDTVSMWMKNTLIPLDMVFIAADARVANVAENAIPGDLTPIQSDGAVIAVLELSGGTAEKLGIKPGDLVRHKIFGNGS